MLNNIILYKKKNFYFLKIFNFIMKYIFYTFTFIIIIEKI